MRFGIFGGTTPDTTPDLGKLATFAQNLEKRGFHSLWLPNIFGLDGVGSCAIVGWETKKLELGTAVTPVYPRHPGALAQQALTTQSACSGRFVLGIGLSHKIVIEDMYGYSYDKPANYMKEYMEILAPLLRGEASTFEGKQLVGKLQIDFPGQQPVPVVIAALGPKMLKLAGTVCDGTSTWMTGEKTIANHIVPQISKAASEAGRPSPRIVCGMPVCLTKDTDAARERIGKMLQIYGMLPSYRAMLDREGVSGPAELAIVGDEKEVRASIQRFRDAGVTDFSAALMSMPDEPVEACLDLLQSEI